LALGSPYAKPSTAEDGLPQPGMKLPIKRSQYNPLRTGYATWRSRAEPLAGILWFGILASRSSAGTVRRT
jgi:hypothetical protein